MRLRREARWLWPIAAVIVVGVACGAWILSKQRLESPLKDRYALHLEFDAVDAVAPGLGSPVTVAGVAVGQIDRADLREGRGVLRVQIDPRKLPHVYADATAALVPNTPLKDMQIRLHPGRRRSAPLGDGGTITLAATTTPVDADELLRSLDADTRDWMSTLLAGLGEGLGGRKADLNAVLRQLGPTAAQMRRVTRLLAQRRRELPKLVDNLGTISRVVAESGPELRAAVEGGAATFEALASEDEPLRRSLELLPGTLAAARSTLTRARPFAAGLDRALRRLDPSLEMLPRTLRESPGALRGLVPLPARELSGFVEGVAPLAPSVRPAARNLAASVEPLRTAFAALERTSNMLVHDAGGDHHSYAFWLAWFAHNANSLTSTQDAHGAVVRGLVLFSCSVPAGLSAELHDLAGRLGGACPEGRR